SSSLCSLLSLLHFCIHLILCLSRLYASICHHHLSITLHHHHLSVTLRHHHLSVNTPSSSSILRTSSIIVHHFAPPRLHRHLHHHYHYCFSFITFSFTAPLPFMKNGLLL